jgi:hypothetical protein
MRVGYSQLQKLYNPNYAQRQICSPNRGGAGSEQGRCQHSAQFETGVSMHLVTTVLNNIFSLFY